MAKPAYQKTGLVMRLGHGNTSEVKALQRDLRALGYLSREIDGDFGKQTELAIRSVQYDLLNNTGESSADDWDAPISIVNFNRGRVVDVTGVSEQTLAACVSDMMVDENFAKLPSSDDPETANQKGDR